MKRTAGLEVVPISLGALCLVACPSDDTTVATEGVAETASGTADSDMDPSSDGTSESGDGDGDGDGECGNGVVEAGEECDDGNTIESDECTNACTAPVCGDGIVQPGEGCDAGADNGPGQPCNSSCQPNVCGDGELGPGEGCDDGNSVDDDECGNDCALPTCGDGQLDLGEACDDGNAFDDDECLNTCVMASCGDGIVFAGVEGCDDGPQNSDTAACTAACVPATCGDGLIWIDVEQCDLGEDNAPSSACLENCQDNVCGDGFQGPGEACDDGNVANDDGCSSICVLEVCGDGITQAGEECDDGNAVQDDDCTNACLLPACGDGILQNNEKCDAGNQNSNTGDCTLACQVAECGDGFVHANVEQCDDGQANSNDAACKIDCTDNYCGDGFQGPGESCDDGNASNNDVCTNVCALATCGDGFVQPGEQCDDDNAVNDDECTNACTTPACGDNILQNGEECDDGNVLANDGCSPSCINEPHAPNNRLLRSSYWGNGGSDPLRTRTIAKFADDDIWFLGEAVVHFDGSWFTQYEVPFGQSLAMFDSATSPQGDVWATDSQKMYHYDGSGWATVDFAQPYDVLGVWRSPTGVIWISAENGVILRSSGNAWVEVPCPVAHDVSSIWGTADADIWAATTQGAIMHWNGVQWTVVDNSAGTFVRIRGVPGTNIVRAVALNGVHRQWNGLVWSNFLGSALYDIWSPSVDKQCVVGTDGMSNGRMSCWDGNVWSTIKPGAADGWIDTMTDLGDQRRVVTDAEDGDVLALDPPNFTTTSALSDQDLNDFAYGAWRRADDDIWVLLSRGIGHWDGSDWQVTQNLGPAASGTMGGFGDTGWISRGVGVFWKFDGNGWVQHNYVGADTGTSAIDLYAPGEGWAVGHNRIHRLQGNAWVHTQNVNYSLSDVYAIGPNDAFAVGSNETILRWDGQNWNLIPNLPISEHNVTTLRSVDGTGPDNVWVVGRWGTVLHWDGTNWTEHKPSVNPFQPEDFGVVEVDDDGVWTRYSNSVRIYRYHGGWTVRTLPWLLQGLVTARASDDSRWWLTSIQVEVWHSW